MIEIVKREKKTVFNLIRFFMEFITSLSRKELEQLISDSVRNCLTDKLSPPQPTQSDRCTLADACAITGLSKAAIYSATHLKRIPYAKFGSRLVFSRRQLAQWVQEHTLTPTDNNEVNDNLKLSAEKKLSHE